MEARMSGGDSFCAASLKSVASLRRSAEVIGELYAHADGVPYLPMYRQPVLVFDGTKETLTAVHSRALARVLPRADGGGDLVGLAVCRPRSVVDKVLKGARMHTRLNLQLNLHSEGATAAQMSSVDAELSWSEQPWQ